MRLIDVDYIRNSMKDETSFVLRCEEVFHDKIGAAAAEILKVRDTRPVVLLTGPSGSGKTTTALRLRDYLENLEVPVCQLSMDNFFLPEGHRPPEAEDWESPYCVDWPLLKRSVEALKEGKKAELPLYDFKTNDRAGSFQMQGSREAVIIIEGIHMLNPLIYEEMKEMSTGVYVAPRTRVVTRDEKVVHPEEIRIVRRMIRDYGGRGRSFRETILRAGSVDAGEMKHIRPNKGNAAIQIDTFHDYELCILAKHLREIPEAEQLPEAFYEENGLSELHELVNELPELHTRYIPRDSIVREFIGGSRYQY